MSSEEALRFFDALVQRLAGGRSGQSDVAGGEVDLGKLRALEGVKEFPSRVKCATLAWHALNSAIHGDVHPATTE